MFREVSVDSQFRMDPEALATQVESDRANGLLPWLLVSTAGTTNTGCIDPLNDLADVAERFDLWHHIDAAYGGFFVLWDEGRRLLDGIDQHGCEYGRLSRRHHESANALAVPSAILVWSFFSTHTSQ